MAETNTAPSPAAAPGIPGPMRGSKLIIGSIAVSLATFMNVLDASIANVSIPAISGDLGVSPNQGTWVITSFAVSNAISVPLTGWLSQRFGQVRLFVTSLILFVIASFLCGFAPSIELLIAFRVLQGAVAGPMIPMSQSLLLSSFPQAKAGTALALWSMTTLAAPVMGPILGGWISDNYSWPWIFFINVPLGLGAAYVSWLLYHQRETPIRKLPIDRIGLSLMVLWIGALQIMLDKGREEDWFNSGFILALGVIAVIGFVFFLIWELNEKHPIVDLSLFKLRNFSGSVIALSLGYGAFFGNVVILPLWLQTQLGYTATEAGLVLAPVGLLAIVMAPLIGRNIHKMDARWLATGGFMTFALVLYMRSRFTTSVDSWTLMLPAYIQGIAMALFFTPLTMIALSQVKPERVPAASGLSNFIRILFGGFGSSIATTAWDNRSSLHHARLMEHATVYDPQFTQGMQNLEQLGMNSDQAHAVFERTLSVQAGMLGANDIFWVSSLLFLGLIIFVWNTKPIHGQKAPVDAGGAH
jgi:DHA2 family multidrug resistance protein